METNSKENRYLKAKEKVQEIKNFYTSLIMYVLVIGFLAGLNYYTNEMRYAWFLWAAFGWGIGLVFQAVKAFDFFPYLSKDWEERKIKKLMEEEDEKQSQSRWQ